MSNLKDLPLQELRAELDRREREEKLNSAPQVQDPIDWKAVIASAVARRDSVLSGEYHEDNDDTQYMFEDVMLAVFGKEYFKWENKQTCG